MRIVGLRSTGLNVTKFGVTAIVKNDVQEELGEPGMNHVVCSAIWVQWLWCNSAPSQHRNGSV